MPELPEVQTVVNDLNKKIKGYEIIDFQTEWAKSIKMPLPEFKKRLVGHRIKKIVRRGKNLLFQLDNGLIMLVHLKMTGHLLVKGDKLKNKKTKDKFFNEKVNQHIRHIWFLRRGRDKRTLEFSDLRKFAKIILLDKESYKTEKSLNNLGMEPLSRDFTEEKLKEILDKKKKTAIKIVLMDQRLIAGIGNIYANEILFGSGIDPRRRAGEIKQKEVVKLYRQIKTILKKAIEMRGTSDSDYRDTDGAPGGFQKILKVYNREGMKCKRKGCRGYIKRIKLGQRSAFYCEECQK
ncbi:MAG: bifunctional DNA-formamidopyrimidine glycosylase/DNA-(apurinic or apyrimidinic site) lyase [Candidatus Moranbacteria bacterium]|jgi:formamidopyrimidine-DNA glycosylase|nr:bifunctional DNA-formamidopyrimidine glycosylase/DNA-(apurinic or apyrimidinic site) lyase [Candidatus Moranbacteria bacterium]